MMGSGRKRGWVIIGMDLLIVLGIYFLYSNFAFESPEVKTASFENTFRYTLTVNEPTADTVPFTVSVTNVQNGNRTVEFPNGMLILLTDGRDKKYWSKQLVPAGSINLQSGEARSWNLAADRPPAPGGVYLELFVDTERQTRIEVPS